MRQPLTEELFYRMNIFAQHKEKEVSLDECLELMKCIQINNAVKKKWWQNRV